MDGYEKSHAMSMAFSNGLPPAPWLQSIAEGLSHSMHAMTKAL
jgi:hypothetical protein